MSMLAERKSKQKWSLNPRGKAWSDDSNKFGQKLMEKMGWSKGKGLGAKENGTVEHVKVSYKNDSRGMGYKESNDQWTEHEINFTALLQSLTGEDAPKTDIKISSLEQKSQSSRVRVHYKKFTRGKDLSRCSEKDLANIFGRKSLKENKTPCSSSKNDDTKEIEEKTTESFTVNGGSMVEYFKKKLPNFSKNNSYLVGNNVVLKEECESEEEKYVGFGFGTRMGEEMNETPKKKRRKICGSENGDVTEHEGSERKGTPKKENEEKGLSNPAFDPLFSNLQVQKHVLNTIEELEEEENEDVIMKHECKVEAAESKNKNEDVGSPNGQKKSEDFKNGSEDLRKKKKKKKFNTAVDNPNFDDADGDDSNAKNDVFEVKRKKPKKNSSVEENSILDSHIDSLNDNSEAGKKKKKKKKEDSSLGIENANFDNLEDSQSSFNNNGFEIKRKKKKCEQISSGTENKNFDSFEDCEIQNICVNNNFEVQRKKKKKKSGEISSMCEQISSGIENQNFDSFEDSEIQNTSVSNNFEVQRKKKKRKSEEISSELYNGDVSQNSDLGVKKKKKKIEDTGIANCNFDDSDNNCLSVRNNNEFEVKRKKKKSVELAIDNPSFDTYDHQNGYVDSSYEVKRKKNKKIDLAVDNPSFEVTNQSEALPNQSTNGEVQPSLDIMLNITSTPCLPKPESTKKSSMKRRKSVRFSDINEERIIPNKEDLKNRNELFNINSKVIENGLKDNEIDEISKKIDGFQAEIENDINQAKLNKFIGEVGNPDGENEKLENGTKLKFKYAKFGRSPYFTNRSTSRAKSSYKHLIKGDIILGFNNTNLHEIVGYGVQK